MKRKSGSKPAPRKTPELPLELVDTDLDEQDEAEGPSSEEPGEDDFEAPLVVLTSLKEVAEWMPPDVARIFGDRPVWFLLEDDAELVGVFERIPEDPMSKGRISAILGGLRAFAADRAEALQALLGPTDGIGVGFHVDAPMARVRASFEEDGFEVAGTVVAGVVTDE